MKKIFVRDLKGNQEIKDSFMIMKILSKDGEKLVAYIGDKTGDIKASIENLKANLEVGDVIKVTATKNIDILIVSEFVKENKFNLDDYLPSINKPINEILDELNKISQEEFKSPEIKALDDYFFKNNSFIEDFKKGIGGLNQHHNYRGGLAEHTLNVMYIAKVLCYRYDCRNKELAILAAKLHDIGKIKEYETDKPFSVSMKGEMEGHIVLGVTMLEEAFAAGGSIYSEDFKLRVKGCIVQHHGKVEYGSPKVPNSEEAYIVHLADYVDATLNKIEQIKDVTEPNTWSQYDRRIGTRLFV